MGGMSSSSDDCRGWASVYSSSSSDESGNLMSPKEVTGLFIAEDGTEACWEVELRGEEKVLLALGSTSLTRASLSRWCSMSM